MRKRTSIVWFKTDLRILDNPVLDAAMRSSEMIIPVYCVDERLFSKTSTGFRKTGKFRAKFLLESLKDLDQQLRTRGSGLLVVWGEPEVLIPEVVEFYRAEAVWCKKEVAPEELAIHQNVERRLFALNCEVETISTSTLYLATDLPFPVKSIPDVFTEFRKRVERECEVRQSLSSPVVIHSPQLPNPEWHKWPVLEHVEFDPRSAFPFTGGESHALHRLNDYVYEKHFIDHYKETRNGLIGQDYSSKLSAWLALGCISPVFIYHEIKRYERLYGGNESTYWLIFELMWRDFFRFMMKKYGKLFFYKNGMGKNGNYQGVVDWNKIKQWVNGNTGVDFVDANMIELTRTGYMSNRGRQNVASFFCHDMKCDWRIGAAYFEEMLIDYDVCSNWGNWAYIAGVGNDPRRDRYFDQKKQAMQYDKDSAYRKLWLEHQSEEHH
ncbi:MAG: DASH family cryptochrome [Flavobacteriales bacterium]|nr:DASH family cryptochrome [Flavobacteriales bacterium]